MKNRRLFGLVGLTLLFACTSIFCQAQTSLSTPGEEIVQDDNLYTLADPIIPPAYPGGELQLMKEVQEQVERAMSDSAEHVKGSVFVAFTIDTTGHMVDLELKRGLAPEIDRCILQALAQLKPWTPAKKDGVTVKMSYMLPITIDRSHLKSEEE